VGDAEGHKRALREAWAEYVRRVDGGFLHGGEELTKDVAAIRRVLADPRFAPKDPGAADAASPADAADGVRVRGAEGAAEAEAEAGVEAEVEVEAEAEEGGEAPLEPPLGAPANDDDPFVRHAPQTPECDRGGG